MTCIHTSCRWPSVLGLVLVVACGDSASVGSSRATWELIEIGRIGTVEGEGTSLSSVSGLAQLDSTLFLIESSPPRAARFRVSGEWLGDFSGTGDGPGELRSPSSIGVTGNRVWVADPRAARLEAFTPDGHSLESFRFSIPPDSLGNRAFPVALLEDGSVLAGPGSVSVGAVIRGALTHGTYYRTTASGEVLGTVYESAVPESDFFQAPLQGRSVIMGGHPIPQAPLVSAFPDGSGMVAVERWISSGSPASFLLRVFNSEGTKTAEVAVPYEPVSGGNWLERFLAEQREAMEGNGGPSTARILNALEENLAPRPFLPPITKALAGRDGSIWLRREETGLDSVRWEILDRSGALAGMTWLGTETNIVLASLDEAWAVETDEFDVPFLVRYRVVR